jgi:cardiolipin synthase
VGQQFVEALFEATRRGVEVRVLVDAAGARYSRPRIDKVLENRGIRVARFLPMALKRLPYFNLRDHRKIMVVDGSVGFTGGMNIRQGHWIARSHRRPVRDVHFELRGPIVSQLQEVFAEDWQFSAGESLVGAPWFAELEPQGPTLARGIPDGPDADLDALNWTILAAIGSARSSLKVATPYFLPDPIHANALKLASLRGVAVDIVLPSRSNLPYMDWAMWGQFWTVLDHGVRLWLSPPPFDHSKLMVVDDHWTLFGSSNWDPRSLRLNFEFNVETYCDELGPKVSALIDERIAASRQVTKEDLDRRPLHLRLRDSVAGLASPYL